MSRVRKHLNYVSSRMAELHNQICKDAVEGGFIDNVKREKLFKYKSHYSYYKKKYEKL